MGKIVSLIVDFEVGSLIRMNYHGMYAFSGLGQGSEDIQPSTEKVLSGLISRSLENVAVSMVRSTYSSLYWKGLES